MIEPVASALLFLKLVPLAVPAPDFRSVPLFGAEDSRAHDSSPVWSTIGKPNSSLSTRANAIACAWFGISRLGF